MTNTGNAPLNITTIGKSGGNVFTLSNNTCAQSTVAAGEQLHHQRDVHADRTAHVSSVITFTDDAANSPQTVKSRGTRPLPVRVLQPASRRLRQGHRGQAGPDAAVHGARTTTSAAFTISSVRRSPATSAPSRLSRQIPAPRQPLAPNATCTFSVPTRPPRPIQQKATVTVTDTAPDAGSDGQPHRHRKSPPPHSPTSTEWSAAPPPPSSGRCRPASPAAGSCETPTTHPRTSTTAPASGPPARVCAMTRGSSSSTPTTTRSGRSTRARSTAPIVYSAPKHLNLRTGRVCKPGEAPT